MAETPQEVLDRYDINQNNVDDEIRLLKEQIQILKPSPKKQKKQQDLDVIMKYKESIQSAVQENENLEELQKNAQQILAEVGLSDEDVDGEIPKLKLRIKEAELDNMNSKKVQTLKEELEPLLKYVELRDKIKQLLVDRPDVNNVQLTNDNAVPSAAPSLLNIDTVVKLIRLHKDGYDDIKGKDIVLFFGKTGAGKTTTINYLAGRTMFLQAMKLADDAIDNVIECKDPLPGFKIGHSAESETFVIRPCDLVDLGLRLCDTPGLKDNRGIEVDIANAVGLYNTIKYARSVKLVLVVEASDVGSTRGTALTDFLSYIRDFVKDFENYKDALALFFTKSTAPNSIYTGVVKLANDKKDPSSQLFLQNIKDYVKKNLDHIIVNPLRPEERAALLSIINSTNNIKTEDSNPCQFGLPLSYQAKRMLLDKDNELLSLINTALGKRAFHDAEKTLQQMGTLAEEVQLPTLTDNYSYAIKLILHAVENLGKEIQSNIQAHNFETVKECMARLWDAQLLKDYLSDLDVTALFKTIQTQINTLASTLAREIREEQSYAAINTKLDILRPIQEHLSNHLLEENQGAFTLATQFVHDCVDKQNATIDEQIQRIRNAQMEWIHEGETVSLPLFLARNLAVFSGLKNLTTYLKENQINLYEEKVASIIAILEDAYTVFSQLIASDTFAPEAKKRYYIVKNVEDTQELLAHIPAQNRRLPEMQKLLHARVEDLRYKVDQSAHEYDYETISSVFPLLYAFLTIDDAFGSAYRLKELHHTIQLIETQIKKTQMDIKNESEKQGALASYAFINEKVFLLSKAKEIEKELSTPGLVSTFLAVLKETFSDKARQIASAASQAFKDNNFTLLAHLVQDFNSFAVLEWFAPEIRTTQQYMSITFTDQVKAAKEASVTHCEALNFKKIAEHHTTLEGFLLVAREVEKGKIGFLGSPIRDQNQNQNADPQLTSSTAASELLTHLIEIQIQTLQDTYASNFTLFMDLFQSISPDSTTKEKTAARMAESLRVMQQIEELHMRSLQLKPPTGAKDAVNKLSTAFRELEISANNHIDRNQFADAEKAVESLKAMTQFALFMSLDISEVYQQLFAKLHEKKHNLKEKIPELLKRGRFTETARALKTLQGSAPKEYEASSEIVKEYFDENFLSKDYSLTSNPTQDIVSTWMNKCFYEIEKLGRAKDIQEVDPQLFRISEISEQIASKVKEYLKMKKRRFQTQLNGFKFPIAYKFVLTMEHTTQITMSFLKELELDQIRNIFEDKLKKVPQEVQTILSSDMDITRVDTICTNLDQLEADEYDGEVDIGALKTQIKDILEKEVSKRVIDIRGFIEKRQATEAESVISKLSAVVELKVFRNTRQDTVMTCKANLESLRQELLNPDLVIYNPEKFSEQLEVLKAQNFAGYRDQIAILETRVTTMKNEMCSILEEPIKLTPFHLQKTAKTFQTLKEIISKFETKHPDFAAKAKLSLEGFTHLLNSFCEDRVNALAKAKRLNSWIDVETQLHFLHQISKHLGECLDPTLKASIEHHNEAVNSVVNELKASWNILMKLDFWAPIVFKELNDTLTKLKRDASAQFDIMSDENPVTYQDAVNLITRKVSELQPTMEAHLTEEKYESILVVLDNLRQYQSIAHDEIHTVLSTAFNRYINSIKENLRAINQQAKVCSRNKDFDRLEKSMMQYRNIEKALGRIPELFPNDRNEIVEQLIENVKQQIDNFRSKHATTVPSIEDVAFLLLELKRMTSKISNTQFAADVHKQMNGLLNSLSERSYDFYALGGYLTSKGPLGREIVEGDSFPQFKALVIAMINKITARITPADALKALKEQNGLSPASVELLAKALDDFTRHFDKILNQYLLSSASELESFVSDFQHEMASYRNIKNWSDLKDKIPYILASVFAVWSISNSASFYAETKDKYSILRPHPIQILSLLRMFEVDTEKGWRDAVMDKVRVFFLSADLRGHLIQIGTGEGKSIILGVLSTILALLGFQISCVCYSSYLSSRDYNSFKDLFIRFGVDKYIKYSTLVDMAGDFINEQGDIRSYTTNFIHGESVVASKFSANQRPRILLIDEVDVFFSRDFYGATYNPSVILKSAEISFILEHIWQNRTRITLNEVKKLGEYKTLIENYKSISSIIDNAILRMMDQSKNFNEPPYDCGKNDLGFTVIGYREGGSVNTHVQHGYKTCFAYLCERDRGVIQKDIAAQHLGLTINCGQFSYAEVPKGFDCILGVTGTLKTLGTFESSVIKEEYKISKQTFTPSIYGNSNLLFKEKEDVLVEDDKSLYFRKMLENIMEKKNQAVLVFFEDEQKMNAFLNSDYARGLTNVNKITENVENIDFYVKKATLSGSVTFLTRVFGRGLDFVCRDDKVEAAGGVHVIQTFLSEDISEEIQIKGRTARQGKKGSFTMILNKEDLIRDFGLTAETIAEEKKSAKLYQFLDKTRKAQFDRKSADRKGIIERSLALHKESLEYRESLVSRNTARVFEYLNKQNPSIKAKSMTVCIFDATGSMKSVWDTARSTVNEIATRITAVGGAGKSQLMWVAYRDYCDDLIVECSEFTDDPKLLHKFINKINCDGGGDTPEAVEIGLKKANEIPGVTRVILIGDAEPHLEGKGNYCAYHKRNLETDYLEQAQKLKEKGIPVYCCYMNTSPNLVQSFTKISEITGGKAVLFADTNTLMDVVSENVLHDIGGEELVLEYRKTYHS